MAGYHGKGGNVLAGAPSSAIGSLDSWSFETSIDLADNTSMGDTWEAHLGGSSDFSGTAEGKAGTAFDTVPMLGSEATTEFQLSTAKGIFTGNAICTGLTETANVDDVGRITYTFEGDSTAGLVYSAGAGDAQTSLTEYHGKFSTAWWDTNSLGNITEWSCALTAGVADSTAMAPTNVGRTKLLGFKAGTASVTVFTSATPLVVGAEEMLELGRDATNASGGYSGSAEVMGVSGTHSKDAVGALTYNFKFNGVVTNTLVSGSA